MGGVTVKPTYHKEIHEAESGGLARNDVCTRHTGVVIRVRDGPFSYKVMNCHLCIEEARIAHDKERMKVDQARQKLMEQQQRRELQQQSDAERDKLHREWILRYAVVEYHRCGASNCVRFHTRIRRPDSVRSGENYMLVVGDFVYHIRDGMQNELFLWPDDGCLIPYYIGTVQQFNDATRAGTSRQQDYSTQRKSQPQGNTSKKSKEQEELQKVRLSRLFK